MLWPKAWGRGRAIPGDSGKKAKEGREPEGWGGLRRGVCIGERVGVVLGFC